MKKFYILFAMLALAALMQPQQQQEITGMRLSAPVNFEHTAEYVQRAAVSHIDADSIL